MGAFIERAVDSLNHSGVESSLVNLAFGASLSVFDKFCHCSWTYHVHPTNKTSRGAYMNVLGSMCAEAFGKGRVVTHSNTREHSPPA